MDCEIDKQTLKCKTDNQPSLSFSGVMSECTAKKLAQTKPDIDISGASALTAATMNGFLDTIKAPNMVNGEMFTKAAEAAGIKTEFLVGIGLAESRLGTHGLGVKSNNIFNVYEGRTLKRYDSMEEGIRDAAATIKQVNDDPPGVVYRDGFAARVRDALFPPAQGCSGHTGYAGETLHYNRVVRSFLRYFEPQDSLDSTIRKYGP